MPGERKGTTKRRETILHHTTTPLFNGRKLKAAKLKFTVRRISPADGPKKLDLLPLSLSTLYFESATHFENH